MLRIENSFLHSVVGRRIFLLFLVATVLPAAMLSILTWRGTERILHDEARAELDRDSKTLGMQILARLQDARTRLVQSDSRAADAPGLLDERFVLSTTGSHVSIFRSFASVDQSGMAKQERSSSPGGETALPEEWREWLIPDVQARPRQPIRVRLLTLPASGGASAFVGLLADNRKTPGGFPKKLAVLEPRFLFGDGDDLPARTNVCVLDERNEPLNCSNPASLGPARAAAGVPAADEALGAATKRQIAGKWNLTLQGEFGAPSWTIVTMRDAADGFGTDGNIGRTYVAVALASLALVALLSLTQIRRTLVPLERLLEGTRRLARRDFSRKIPIEREDEFAELARAFNDMAGHLQTREQRLVHEARHDSLTGLANRTRLHEILQARCTALDAAKHAFAILFVDLDRFKRVNDGLGHDAGDALLVQAAERIAQCVRPGDSVARLGGDEFVVVAAGYFAKADIDALAAHIIASLSAAFPLGNSEAFVSASIGIARFPEHGATREDLIRHADIAMYEAKKAGRGRFAVFDETMNRMSTEALGLEKDLRLSLANDEITVAFQPRVRLRDGQVTGAEALARWYHAERGSVPPAVFVPVAEEVGLIDLLGTQVLAQACEHLAGWKTDDIRPGRISVNLSPRQLRSPELLQQVRFVVRQSGLSPRDIEFEITESALVENFDASRAALTRFREAGFTIALDDFGTGYSSLSYLQNLPIDVMKIDRSFVHDLESNAGSRAIAIAIISMAHTLGMKVVAEGVETRAQAALLLDWGCDEGQGFLFATPLPPDAFASWVEKEKHTA